MLGLGFGEMVLIFAVLLLLFGAKRLPELASGVGKGIREFKSSLNGADDPPPPLRPAPREPTPNAVSAPVVAAADAADATLEAEVEAKAAEAEEDR